MYVRTCLSHFDYRGVVLFVQLTLEIASLIRIRFHFEFKIKILWYDLQYRACYLYPLYTYNVCTYLKADHI